MRLRLTLAFVGVAAVVLTVVGVVRTYAISDIIRTSEVDNLHMHAMQVAELVETLHDDGDLVKRSHIIALTAPETRLTVTHGAFDPIVVEGAGFTGGAGGDALEVTHTVGDTTVTAVASEERVALVTSDRLGALLALMVAMVVFAGVFGWYLAGVLSRPITRLARSAEALGRGRFDLDIPRSGIPEVQTLSYALQGGAHRMERSIQRDREYVQHISHLLRTPVTALRLELEEMSIHDDHDVDVRRALDRALADVARLEQTVADLLEFQRSRSLISGAEVSLVELGREQAQRWRDALPESRALRSFVDDGEDLSITPGPIEQLLDHLLRDVREWGSGPVELRFAGEHDHLRLSVKGGPPKASGMRTEAEAARTVTELLGGRWEGDALDDGLQILLPRR